MSSPSGVIVRQTTLTDFLIELRVATTLKNLMRTFILLVFLNLGLAPWVCGQTSPVISSFSHNGALVCTNLQPGSTATVEWASSLSGPWTNSWAGLDSVLVDSSGAIQVSVPMFYRVRGTPAGIVEIETAATNLTVLEGSSATLGVRLTAQPTATTIVTIGVSDTSKATASPSTLNFTTANWSIFQTITVNGVSDANAIDENTTLNLTSSGLSNRTVNVTVTDDDVQDIVLSTTALTVGEAGNGTFNVRLAAQPVANVIVTLSSANTAKATISPPTLTFSTSNWNTPQTVTVNGVNDADVVNESVNMSVASTSLTTRSVTVTVIDDDVMGIETSVTGLTVGESGSGNFGVRLTAQPPSNVTVTVSSQDTAKATVAPPSLSFTPVNWNTYQTATVNGVNDANTSNESVTMTLSSSGLSNQTVTVTVTDDD